MQVFIPALKSANPFFDEIMSCSTNTYIFDDFRKYKQIYKTVLIHWPESIFNWKEPSIWELEELQAAIEEWKHNSKIIYVVHNLERHYGMTLKFKELYQLVESSCDAMIHFGNFSRDIFIKKAPNIIHKVIEHPLYEKSYSLFSKYEARKKLNINKNAVVIVASGAIRNKNERQLIISSFNELKLSNKVLIVPRMFRNPLPFEFKRWNSFVPFIYFNKLLDYLINEFPFLRAKFIVKYKFLPDKDLSLIMSASDIVLIPRIKILNSGNVFLGMTYRKIVVGPERGNITEILLKLKMPIFNPDKKETIVDALNKAIILKDCYNYNDHFLTEFSPKTVAQKWDELIDYMDIPSI